MRPSTAFETSLQRRARRIGPSVYVRETYRPGYWAGVVTGMLCAIAACAAGAFSYLVWPY